MTGSTVVAGGGIGSTGELRERSPDWERGSAPVRSNV
jgi:hypothetical protein